MFEHIKKSGQFITLSAFVIAVAYIFSAALVPSDASNELTVSFLDIGQGDATFIQTPGGSQILIDGGKSSSVLRELADVMPASDRSIDIVIATHPDADHIGGLIDVLERYDVDVVMRPGVSEHDTPVVDAFDAAVREEGIEPVLARRGQEFSFQDGTHLTILFPDRDVSELESNTASIVAQLTYGEHEFLLTGDSPDSIEEYLVGLDAEQLHSDVLKVGHHGSKTSSAEIFIQTVDPDYAVISRGCNNRYGHPHAEVMGRFEEYGIDIYDTCEDGTVTFISDGTTLSTKKDRE